MTVRRFGLGLCLGCALALAPTSLFAQEKKDPKDAKPAAGKPAAGQPAEGAMTPEAMAEMDAWMKASMPGPEHKNLEYMVGNWDVSTKTWMSPGMEPMTSKGTSTCEWSLGGRFTHYTFKGDFMGMPFEGHGYTGYDNIQKKYVSIWMDTMMTGMISDTGTYDAATKTFTYQGQMTEPTGRITKTRTVIRVVSNDEHMMEFHHAGPDGKEMKVMELAYKRAGKAAAPGTAK